MSSSTAGITRNQHYRESTALGTSLKDALDDLIQDGRVTPNLAHKILNNFDVAVADVLANDVKATFKTKAQLHSYNHVEDVLIMEVSGRLTLKHDKECSEELECSRMRIVAMRAQDAEQASQISAV